MYYFFCFTLYKIWPTPSIHPNFADLQSSEYMLSRNVYFCVVWMKTFWTITRYIDTVHILDKLHDVTQLGPTLKNMTIYCWNQPHRCTTNRTLTLFGGAVNTSIYIREFKGIAVRIYSCYQPHRCTTNDLITRKFHLVGPLTRVYSVGIVAQAATEGERKLGPLFLQASWSINKWNDFRRQLTCVSLVLLVLVLVVVVVVVFLLVSSRLFERRFKIEGNKPHVKNIVVVGPIPRVCQFNCLEAIYFYGPSALAVPMTCVSLYRLHHTSFTCTNNTTQKRMSGS